MRDFIKRDCPRCGARGASFEFLLQRTVEVEEKLEKIGVSRGEIYAKCGVCDFGITITHTYRSGTLVHERILPPPPDTGAPEHTPERVAEYYEQGMRNYPGDRDAAVAMFRAALEFALKDILQVSGKKQLTDLIKKAREKGHLTENMANWANEIRLQGNNAVHEEEPFSPEDVEDIKIFTEMMLICLFKLPGMIKEAQNKRKVAKNDDSIEQEPSSDPNMSFGAGSVSGR